MLPATNGAALALRTRAALRLWTPAHVTSSSLFLFSLVFLLIYGPRMFGSTALDLITFAALVAVGYSLVSSRAAVAWVPGSTLQISALGVLTVYALIITITSPTPELFYPAKFIRAALNYGGVYVLSMWYWRKYGREGIYIMLEHVFWAVAVHALVMVLQYTYSGFANIIWTISGYSRDKSLRVTGLTISYNTLNLVQGFGLLLAILLRDRMRSGWKRVCFIPAAALVITSLFIAGRTAAFIMGMFCFIALVVGFRRFLLRMSTLWYIAGMIAVVVAIALVIPADDLERFQSGTLKPILEPITAYLQYGSIVGTHARATAELLARSMWFFPQDERVLLWGSSLSGRGDIEITSDIGFVLFIFGIGVVGTIAVVLLYAHMLILAKRWRRFDGWIAYAMAAFTLAVVMLHFKEQTILTRHAYTISAILVSWYYILTAERQLTPVEHAPISDVYRDG
jgi:hypothetical protein